jgi:hypothetical protein
MAGVLLTNVHASTDTMYAVFNPELGMWAALIPQAGDQSRAYFVYPKTMGYRLQGESMLSLFVRESAKAYPPIADYCADGKVSDHWRALTSAILGWSIPIAMAWRCLAMLRQLLTQPTARGFFRSTRCARASRRTNEQFGLGCRRSPLR